jgi:hypothetical protein
MRFSTALFFLSCLSAGLSSCAYMAGYLEGRHTPIGENDPLLKGIEAMFEVPGFPLYAEAVGFPSRERAAIYASQDENKPEVISALTYLQDNPWATSHDLVRHQLEQGYPTTPMMRVWHRPIDEGSPAAARRRYRNSKREIRSEKRENEEE